LAVPTIRS
jgi:hypothetical protein